MSDASRKPPSRPRLSSLGGSFASESQTALFGFEVRSSKRPHVELLHTLLVYHVPDATTPQTRQQSRAEKRAVTMSLARTAVASGPASPTTRFACCEQPTGQVCALPPSRDGREPQSTYAEYFQRKRISGRIPGGKMRDRGALSVSVPPRHSHFVTIPVRRASSQHHFLFGLNRFGSCQA
jgi:hypothetical protein